VSSVRSVRVVFDTTILASLSIATKNPLAFLRHATQHRLFELCVSEFILDELERTLKKPYFVSRLPDHGIAWLGMLRQVARVVPVSVTLVGVVSDPNDDAILSTAVSAQAHYVVSGDKAILAVGQVQGIPVLTARQFYDVLQQQP
jgi:putative PIN family toxin of toxin-antitoxin system